MEVSDINAITLASNNLVVPDKGLTLTEYHKALQSLGGIAVALERNSGRVAWIQGMILLRAKEVCPRGKWIEFLNGVGMGEKTAYLLRKVAENVSEENSLNWKYTEMLSHIFPSFRNDLATEIATEASADSPPTQSNETKKPAKQKTKRKTYTSDSVSKEFKRMTSELEDIEKRFKVDDRQQASALLTPLNAVQKAAERLIHRLTQIAKKAA